MRELVETIDALAGTAAPSAGRSALVERLDTYRATAEGRCVSLRGQLADAEARADELCTGRARHEARTEASR